MKIFVKNLFLFLSVPMLIVLADLAAPLHTFTFREWEALESTYPVFSYGAFYPKQEVSMREFGDLGRHTPYAIGRYTTWRTDAIGYRNDQFIPEPDILLIGDSYFTGSSITQDASIGTQLQKALDSISIKKYSIYNMSPGSFEQFNYLLNSGIIRKPKSIVFSIAERSVRNLLIPELPDKLNLKQKFINTGINYIPYQVPMLIDKAVKLNILRYATARLNPVELRKYGADYREKEIANRSNPKMLFFKNGQLPDNDSLSVYQQAIRVLSAYKSYCDKLGIALIFAPIPDKQTIYYDRVSPTIKQSFFLAKLDSVIRKSNIHTINTFALFSESKKRNPGRLLYLYDDVHWNDYGVSVLAGQLAKEIISINTTTH